MFREVTPVGHSNLKAGWTDYRESSVGKRSHAGLTLLNVIDSSSTKGFLEILSNVLVTQERFFTYGRPDESCSSFTLMYFDKRRVSRINLFWSR